MVRLFVAITVIALAGASVARGAEMAPEAGPTAVGAPTCVGIVLPSVQGVDGNAGDVAGTVRELFTARLTGPSLQAMSLDARLPAQALEEARQKQCEHVLIATLTRGRDGGGSSVFGKMLGGAGNAAAWHIPGGSSAISDVARGTAMAGVQAVTTTLASSTRAKDELRLEYKLASANGTTQLASKTEKAKAEADGIDLLTPLVDKAAETIAAAVARK